MQFKGSEDITLLGEQQPPAPPPGFISLRPYLAPEMRHKDERPMLIRARAIIACTPGEVEYTPTGKPTAEEQMLTVRAIKQTQRVYYVQVLTGTAAVDETYEEIAGKIAMAERAATEADRYARTPLPEVTPLLVEQSPQEGKPYVVVLNCGHTCVAEFYAHTGSWDVPNDHPNCTVVRWCLIDDMQKLTP